MKRFNLGLLMVALCLVQAGVAHASSRAEKMKAMLAELEKEAEEQEAAIEAEKQKRTAQESAAATKQAELSTELAQLKEELGKEDDGADIKQYETKIRALLRKLESTQRASKYIVENYDAQRSYVLSVVKPYKEEATRILDTAITALATLGDTYKIDLKGYLKQKKAEKKRSKRKSEGETTTGQSVSATPSSPEANPASGAVKTKLQDIKKALLSLSTQYEAALPILAFLSITVGGNTRERQYQLYGALRNTKGPVTSLRQLVKLNEAEWEPFVRAMSRHAKGSADNGGLGIEQSKRSLKKFINSSFKPGVAKEYESLESFCRLNANRTECERQCNVPPWKWVNGSCDLVIPFE